MSTLALPQVIDNLITTLSGTSALSGVRIFDGPEIDLSYPSDFIVVGHDGSEDGDVSVANITNIFQQLGNMKQFEDGNIECFMVTQSGGTSLSARRTRAGVLLSAIDTALRANANLSESCLYSIVQNQQWSYLQTDVGSAVTVGFTINYRART